MGTKESTRGTPQHAGGSRLPASVTLPVSETGASWREHALTRIESLDDAVQRLRAVGQLEQRVAERVGHHLVCAQRTAEAARGDLWGHRWANSVHVERVMTHINAGEALVLESAPLAHVACAIPGIVDHVRSHLDPDSVHREQTEAIGHFMRDDGKARLSPARPLSERDRGVLVAAFRAASEAERQEIMKVRSFRNILLVACLVLTTIVVVLGVLGAVFHEDVDVCFNPVEADGGGKIVCPLGEVSYSRAPSDPDGPDLAELKRATSSAGDVTVVLVIGAAAAALAGAVALSKIRGSSTPYSLPVALAMLKLPTGALTALLGLLLLRGQFVPGFSALDFPAQVLAWAVVLGYAQQLLTRLIDRQAQVVLEGVGTSSSS